MSHERQDNSRESDSKFLELVLYVAAKSQFDEYFGATKLNKILFYSEVLTYFRTKKPITGQAYQKLANGPAPRHLVPIREAMIANQDCLLQARDFHGKR